MHFSLLNLNLCIGNNQVSSGRSALSSILLLFYELVYNNNENTYLKTYQILQYFFFNTPMIASDHFKLKKLNPSKLYKALQSYYLDCITEKSPTVPPQVETFNKLELNQIIKTRATHKDRVSQDHIKLHKMFKRRKMEQSPQQQNDIMLNVEILCLQSPSEQASPQIIKQEMQSVQNRSRQNIMIEAPAIQNTVASNEEESTSQYGSKKAGQQVRFMIFKKDQNYQQESKSTGLDEGVQCTEACLETPETPVPFVPRLANGKSTPQLRHHPRIASPSLFKMQLFRKQQRRALIVQSAQMTSISGNVRELEVKGQQYEKIHPNALQRPQSQERYQQSRKAFGKYTDRVQMNESGSSFFNQTIQNKIKGIPFYQRKESHDSQILSSSQLRARGLSTDNLIHQADLPVIQVFKNHSSYYRNPSTAQVSSRTESQAGSSQPAFLQKKYLLRREEPNSRASSHIY